jgi:hypothetical protein
VIESSVATTVRDGRLACWKMICAWPFVKSARSRLVGSASLENAVPLLSKRDRPRLAAKYSPTSGPDTPSPLTENTSCIPGAAFVTSSESPLPPPSAVAT